MSYNFTKDTHELVWDSILAMDFEQVTLIISIEDLQKVISGEIQEWFLSIDKTCTEANDFTLQYIQLLKKNKYFEALKDLIEDTEAVYIDVEREYLESFRSLCSAIKAIDITWKE